MYEKETDTKVDELISIVKAIDTKIKFILDDVEELKNTVSSIEQTVVQTAMLVNSDNQRSATDNSKAARLEAFREQSQRW
jgi:hypothetical protein